MLHQHSTAAAQSEEDLDSNCPLSDGCQEDGVAGIPARRKASAAASTYEISSICIKDHIVVGQSLSLQAEFDEVVESNIQDLGMEVRAHSLLTVSYAFRSLAASSIPNPIILYMAESSLILCAGGGGSFSCC